MVSILDIDYMIGYLLRSEYETLGECPDGCCRLMGDFNHDGVLDETDGTMMIDWLVWQWPYRGQDPYCCDEVDVVAPFGSVDILDADAIIHAASQGTSLGPCNDYSGSNDWCWKCFPPK